MKRFLALVLCFSAGLFTAHARVDLLLVPPVDPVVRLADGVFTLYLNNPTGLPEEVELPLLLPADYASSAGHGRLTLALVDPADARRTVPAMSRLTIKLRLTDPLDGERGFVSLRLTAPLSNAVMFELAAPMAGAQPEPAPAFQPAAEPSALVPGHQLDLTTDVENMRRHISAYAPIYFAVGSRARLNARFQFSFKYRVFEPGLESDPFLAQLPRDLYFAYTQTSIWDLDSFSKPFYDTSYQPTIFVLHEFRGEGPTDPVLSLQLGVQHESNGKGGAPTVSPAVAIAHPFDSRSANTFYFAPKIRWSATSGAFFELGARASSYFQIDENPDLPRFRGYVELMLKGGYDRGIQLSTHLRGHPSGHGSVEFNLTWPAVETPLLKLILPRTLGGYAQLQYFNGYGESLLDYDVRRRDQLRFGLMIVR